MAAISQYGSLLFTGSHPNKLPDGIGDILYEQDRIRDQSWLMDRIGALALDALSGATLLMSGGIITLGGGYTQVNISPAVGYAPFTVALGNTAGVPPQTVDEDITAVRIASAQVTNGGMTGGVQTFTTGTINGAATLDGSTPNLVKMKYAENNGLTRLRAKAGGSWYFTKVPSWVITISAAAASAYEVVLGTIIGNGTSTFTAVQYPAVNIFQQFKDLAMKMRMEALI